MLMEGIDVQLDAKKAEGFVIPLGSLNLVFAKTDRGMIGCGALDVLALEKFNYPAARVKPKKASIGNIDDLLEGEISIANAPARALGVHPGMSGREALERF